MEMQRLIDGWVRSLERTHEAPKPDLLARAAHELRTPLTTLLAQAQDLERRIEKDPDRCPDPAAVHRIATEAQRLRALIEELVEVERAEAGRLRADREPVDIADLAREVCASLGADRAVVEASMPVVGLYDPRRVALLIELLVQNALQYGGAPIRVLVWQQGDRAYLAVQDRGAGIPAEDVPHVFERFRRGSNVADRSAQGLGLGLYLAKAIVEAHQGAIAIYSTAADGTTVTVALPSPMEPGMRNA